MTHEIKQTRSAPLAKGVKKMWGLSLDSWNNVIVGFLALGAVAAVVVGVSTYIAFQLQKQEAKDSKDELDKYKIEAATRVEEAKTAGIEAGKKAADALLKAAGLEKEAAELTAQNLKLEAAISPRRLNADDLAKLSHTGARFRGRTISIWSYGMDAEGGLLAVQIRDALAVPSSSVGDHIGAMMFSINVRVGVRLTGPDDELIAALLAALSPLSPVRDPYTAVPGNMPAAAEIFIGVKPIKP
jgi:hypothetical protein